MIIKKITKIPALIYLEYKSDNIKIIREIIINLILSLTRGKAFFRYFLPSLLLNYPFLLYLIFTAISSQVTRRGTATKGEE